MYRLFTHALAMMMLPILTQRIQRALDNRIRLSHPQGTLVTVVRPLVDTLFSRGLFFLHVLLHAWMLSGYVYIPFNEQESVWSNVVHLIKRRECVICIGSYVLVLLLLLHYFRLPYSQWTWFQFSSPMGSGTFLSNLDHIRYHDHGFDDMGVGSSHMCIYIVARLSIEVFQWRNERIDVIMGMYYMNELFYWKLIWIFCRRYYDYSVYDAFTRVGDLTHASLHIRQNHQRYVWLCILAYLDPCLALYMSHEYRPIVVSVPLVPSVPLPPLATPATPFHPIQ
jgi:hypothetical protein